MLLGSAEQLESETPDGSSKKLNRKSRVVVYYGLATEIFANSLTTVNSLLFGRSRSRGHHSKLTILLKNMEAHIEHFLDSFSRSKSCKHRLCTHRYNCFIYSIIGFLQRFIAGYLLQAAVKCLGSVGAIIKKPRLLLKILLSPVNKQLGRTLITSHTDSYVLNFIGYNQGMFLGSYVLIFRAVSCLLKHLTNKTSPLHGLVSGFFAGWSMMFYKSSSISMYLLFKLLEVNIYHETVLLKLTKSLYKDSVFHRSQKQQASFVQIIRYSALYPVYSIHTLGGKYSIL